jgi:hypothetical protein
MQRLQLLSALFHWTAACCVVSSMLCSSSTRPRLGTTLRLLLLCNCLQLLLQCAGH